MRISEVNKPAHSRRVATAMLALLLWSATYVRAQTAPPAANQDGSIKVNVDLVALHVSVTDADGKPFLGLNAENFRVLDNGTEQALRHFSTRDSPFSMGLVLDRSGSMSMMMEELASGKIAEGKPGAPKPHARTHAPGTEPHKH